MSFKIVLYSAGKYQANYIWIWWRGQGHLSRCFIYLLGCWSAFAAPVHAICDGGIVSEITTEMQHWSTQYLCHLVPTASWCKICFHFYHPLSNIIQKLIINYSLSEKSKYIWLCSSFYFFRIFIRTDKL